MNTIVKSKDDLEKIRGSPLYETFSRLDHNGKISWMGRALSAYYYGEDLSGYTKGEKEFFGALKDAVGVSGLWALLTTLEGSRTYSKNRDCSIDDVIEETERILNDEEYRKLVDTELKKNPEFYEMLKEGDNHGDKSN